MAITQAIGTLLLGREKNISHLGIDPLLGWGRTTHGVGHEGALLAVHSRLASSSGQYAQQHYKLDTSCIRN